MVGRVVLTSITLLLVLHGSVADDAEEILTAEPTGTTKSPPPATTNRTEIRTEIITAPPVKCERAGYYYDPADEKCKTCGVNTYNPPESDVCIPCPTGLVSPGGPLSTSEEDCVEAEACPEKKIRCADGLKCIDEWKLCDGKNDCKDGSDETDTLCRSGTCPEGTTTCADNVTCVSTRGWCDGRPVCPENEDEDYEFCKGYKCAAHDWKCGEGTRCITRWVICDGKVDCVDGSDEAEDMCRNYECPNKKVQCLDGLQCISKSRLCDGKLQCHDGSDEGIRNDETCPGGYDEFDANSKPSIREILEILKSKCKPPRVWRRRKCRRPARRIPGPTDDPVDPVTTVTPMPGTTDAPCPESSYRTADGSCEQCGENTYLVVLDKTCVPCPEGKVSPAGSTSPYDCYYEPCEAGDYMTPEGCKQCPANTWSADGAKKCKKCPEGLFAAPGSTSKDACDLEQLPTCDCNIPECDYCTKMECTVQQDLFTSEVGVIVTSKVKWNHYNTIVFYDEDGQIISKLQWSKQNIVLTGCATCKTPQPLKDASQGDSTSWGISLKDGHLKITVDGEVLYERQLPEECANIYTRIKRFSFSDMTCENTFSYIPHEMELGERVTPDCGGFCPTEE